MKDLIGKLVVIEFERAGNTNQRTIARLIDISNGLVELEAPRTKNRYAVTVKAVVEINELPSWKIKHEALR